MTTTVGKRLLETTIVDLRGDLIVGTTDNTVTRVPAGTDGQVLSPDSITPAGLIYRAANRDVAVWSSGMSVRAGDSVFVGGLRFIALDTHVAGATFNGDAAHWLLTGIAHLADAGTWASTVAYAIGDIVTGPDGRRYIAVQQHQAAATFAADAAFWAVLDGGAAAALTGATSATAGVTGQTPAPAAGAQDLVLHGDATWRTVIPAWVAATAYSAGAVVSTSGGIWRRTAAGTSGATFNAAEQGAWTLLANIVTSALTFRGGLDASGGTFPAGAAVGDFYKITVAGTIDGVAFSVGDSVFAEVANASTTTYASNWLRVGTPPPTLMVGATGAAVGAAGTVPAPAAGDQERNLTGAATWVMPALRTWSASNTYAVNDLVANAGRVYRCSVAVGPSATVPSADTAHWTEISATTTVADPAWAATTAYTVGQLAATGGVTWRCTTAHTSGASFASTNWEPVSIAFQPVANGGTAFLRSYSTAEPAAGANITVTAPAPSVGSWFGVVNTGAATGTVTIGTTVLTGPGSAYWVANAAGSAWVLATNTTAAMTAATASTAGTGGTVPAPAAGQQDAYLTGGAAYVAPAVLPWDSTRAVYPVNTLVSSAGHVYRCTTATTTAGTAPVSDAAHWVDIAAATPDTIQTLTATGAVTAWDSLVVVNSAGAATVTLPAAVAGSVGRTVRVKSIGAGAVTIAGNGTDVVTGATLLGLGDGHAYECTAAGAVQRVDFVPAPSRGVNVSNRTASGPMGTAAATVDVADVISLSQLTVGIAMTLPAPTQTSSRRTVVVVNSTSSSVAVTVGGVLLPVGAFAEFAWDGANWTDQRVSVRTVDVADMTANGAVGTAAATVDTAEILSLTQTTAGITATLPNPSDTATRRTLTVVNRSTATASITVGGVTLAPGRSTSFIWDGFVWAQGANSPVALGIGQWKPSADATSVTIGHVLSTGTTVYQTGTNVTADTAGVISLKAGKRYRLDGWVHISTLTGADPEYAWVDATANTELVGTNTARSVLHVSGNGTVQSPQARATMLYQPAADQTVKLRAMAGGSAWTVLHRSSGIIVEELPIASVVPAGTIVVNPLTVSATVGGVAGTVNGGATAAGFSGVQVATFQLGPLGSQMLDAANVTASNSGTVTVLDAYQGIVQATWPVGTTGAVSLTAPLVNWTGTQSWQTNDSAVLGTPAALTTTPTTVTLNRPLVAGDRLYLRLRYGGLDTANHIVGPYIAAASTTVRSLAWPTSNDVVNVTFPAALGTTVTVATNGAPTAALALVSWWVDRSKAAGYSVPAGTVLFTPRQISGAGIVNLVGRDSTTVTVQVTGIPAGSQVTAVSATGGADVRLVDSGRNGTALVDVTPNGADTVITTTQTVWQRTINAGATNINGAASQTIDATIAYSAMLTVPAGQILTGLTATNATVSAITGSGGFTILPSNAGNITLSPSFTSVNRFTTGVVNSGVDVTFGTIRARLAPSGNRSIMLSMVSGTATLSGVSWSPNIDSGSFSISATTTAQYIRPGANYGGAGDDIVAIVADSTSGRNYEVHVVVGSGFANNVIFIRELI